MAMDKDFLAGFFEGREDADDVIGKILKEHEADVTGLKVNRDAVLKENKDYKERQEKHSQEWETAKSGFAKRIEELESQAKASGNDETKAIYETKLKDTEELYKAKLADAGKTTERHRAEHEKLYGEYLEVLKQTEFDRAMNGIPNLDPAKKEILRTTFWGRNQFDLKEVDNAQVLLNTSHRGIEDTLKTFIGTDEGKFFVVNNNSGGGATGSTSAKPVTGNPWMKDKENLDEQGRIHRENPERAKQLMKEAGVSSKRG